MMKMTTRNIILTGTLVASTLALTVNWIMSRESALQEKVQIDKIAEGIQLKLKAFEHVSQGIYGLLHLNAGDIAPDDFRSYAQSLNFFKSSDGALGFGFIRKVDTKDLGAYLKNRKLHDPRFHDHYLGLRGQKNHYFIELVEPFERNRSAIGLDIGSEVNRREAAERAALTGLPALTRKIQLVQSDKQEAGFLYFSPVYRTIQIPEKDKREKEIIGFTYAPILASHLASIPNSDDFNIRIYQDNDLDGSNLLFDNSKATDFHAVWKKNVEMGGLNWVIQAEPRDVGILDHSRIIIAFMTFIIFFLLVYVVLSRLNKIADEKIREHKDFLQKVINGIPSMIGYWDRHLINHLSNNSYQMYFGKTMEEISGHHISELLGKEIYEKNLPFLEAALAGKEQLFERVLPLPDGGHKHTLANYIPDIVDGEVKGIIVIVTDITEIKRMEEERHLLQARMMYSSKMATLGEMASGLAHEVNNPLAIILGKIQMLKDQIQLLDNSQKLLNILKSIETSTERVSVVIQGLSYFTEEERNSFVIRENLSMIIQKTLSFCSERFVNHGIALEVNCPSDIFIDCVPSEISQMLLNLLNNAHDAVENLPEKWVKLRVRTFQGQVEISVTDSGRGIPSSHHEKIMEPFFTTKGPQQGSGLGLSISLGIAKKHHGSLSYDSLNDNTRFVVTLPVASE